MKMILIERVIDGQPVREHRPEHELERTTTFVDSPTEWAMSVAYRLNGEIVHHTAWVNKKESGEAASVLAAMVGNLGG